MTKLGDLIALPVSMSANVQDLVVDRDGYRALLLCVSQKGGMGDALVSAINSHDALRASNEALVKASLKALHLLEQVEIKDEAERAMALHEEFRVALNLAGASS